MTLPKGWQMKPGDSGPVLSIDGVDEIGIWLLELPAEDPAASIQAALTRLDLPRQALISATEAALPQASWTQEIYAQAAFSEIDIEFGAPPFMLHGTMSLPAGDGPFPVVVIAHGSGPQNRDGLVGPPRPYRDLAQGLASRGIAALRYNKCAFAHASAIRVDRRFTVDSETTDDALLAAPARPFSVILAEQLDTIAEARGIRRPLLNLHGERDYQVRMQDFASWQAALGDQPQVTTRSYPRLDHFFMAQGDLSRMGIAQDYAIPDSLAEAVIDDIAGWIGSLGRGA